ncbi:MAG TPA: FlgD immunoglobulin-like domain containing protein [bacterium]|nr:FlgD immunoglobulin-like domain containing protein [bacterium]HPN44066.1 FlgD immunoglobulin-like domain containing protein [bacterium]
MNKVLFLLVVIITTTGLVQAGSGSGDSASGFLTSLPPEMPSLCLPANGATGITNPVVLYWHKVPHAATYSIQVSLTVDFDILVVWEGELTDTTFSVYGLPRSTTYFWIVNAVNIAGESLFTPIWSFVTGANAPGIPNLVSPLNGATGVAVNTELKWNVVASATCYYIQVSTLSDFSSIVYENNDEVGTWCQVPGLSGNTQYFWHIGAINAGGMGAFSPTWMFTTGSGSAITGRQTEILPEHYALLPAFPNPFNATTAITFQVPRTSLISLVIYNSVGQSIRKLAAGMQQAGSYTTVWDGCDDHGRVVSSGVYLCRFESGEHVFMQKMLLLQ